MFRLTREVRFAINDVPDHQHSGAPTNSYAGYPTLTGFGQYFRLQVTLEGKLDPKSGYLRNIKEIDQVVRERIIGGIAGARKLARDGQPDLALRSFISSQFAVLDGAWPGDQLHSMTLWLTPFLSFTQLAAEYGMSTRLNQKFEFSASHRLHNPHLSDEENRKIYGKCNNPNGHGHNYEVQVTLKGKPNASGLLVDVPAFELVVKQYVIDKLDHKNLNVDVPEFKELIPTVENIAMTIFRMLKSRFTGIGADLASVTVWETPKTWCEYTEDK
jgi:6-pyruvoyltetrahydropterin/6-carboxytetrahydropterin synthase